MFTAKFCVVARTECNGYSIVTFRHVKPKDDEVPGLGLSPYTAPDNFELYLHPEEFANYPVGLEFELVPTATRR